MSIWTTLMDDAELTEVMPLSASTFLFLTLFDLWEATGEEEGDRHHADVSLVDLDAIPAREKEQALKSYGWDGPLDPLAMAECLHSYGCKAPLFSTSGGNRREVHREARRSAREFARDTGALDAAMDRPVNAIGSTAAEFMSGDILAGLARGVHAGRPEARTLAKMYGVPPDIIDDSRPDDWLPYMMGYMSGTSGGPRETDPDTCDEYYQGYERGERVARGEAAKPGWIK